MENQILSSLQNGDYKLALRRLLDSAYDTDNFDLICEAVKYSKDYNSNGHNDAWLEKVITYVNGLPATTKRHAEKIVVATKISKQYNNAGFSLKPLDIELLQGQIVGIVGENGNGKTTLLRSLAGQLLINDGEIAYPSLKAKTDYDLKSKIAFIPQRIPRWYGELKENLHHSAASKNILGAKNEILVDFVLERFGLAKYAHLTWNEISSGYRTRFEIARIFLQSPELLILDEPLANLDINAQQTLLVDLQMLCKKGNSKLGIVLSSQQLHEVEKVADDIIFLANGVHKKIGDSANASATMIEIESNANTEVIQQLLGAGYTVQFNGGYHCIGSNEHSAIATLQKLITNNIDITYYRDISNSTKRLFQS